MKQKIILLILVLYTCVPIIAQHRHEFSLNAGGGLSSLQYNPADAKFTPGFGGEAGIGYHFFFSPNWGIGTGLNAAFYNSKATIDNYSRTSLAKSPKGTEFDFAYTYSGYKETVSSVMFTIPIMLQFQTSGKTIFYAAAGGKIGLPVSSKLKTTADELTTTGYFQGTKVLYYEDMPMKGLGRYNNVNEKTDLELKTAFMLSAEAGLKWRLGEQWNLYTGIYCDYGLNNINKEKTADTDLLTYNPKGTSYPAGFNYGGLAGISDKLAPLAAGIKLRISFGRKSFSPKVIEQSLKPAVAKPLVDDSAEREAEARRQAELQAQQQREAEARRQAELQAQQRAADAQREAEEGARRQAELQAQQQREAEARRQEIVVADKETLHESIEYYSLAQVDPNAVKTRYDAIVEVLKRHPEWKIRLEGNTCDIGSDEVNMKVGQQRADDAKKYMVEQGIDASRIATLSRGESNPLVPNTSEANRLKNRRVEVICVTCE